MPSVSLQISIRHNDDCVISQIMLKEVVKKVETLEIKLLFAFEKMGISNKFFLSNEINCDCWIRHRPLEMLNDTILLKRAPEFK